MRNERCAKGGGQHLATGATPQQQCQPTSHGDELQFTILWQTS